MVYWTRTTSVDREMKHAFSILRSSLARSLREYRRCTREQGEYSQEAMLKYGICLGKQHALFLAENAGVDIRFNAIGRIAQLSNTL